MVENPYQSPKVAPARKPWVKALIIKALRSAIIGLSVWLGLIAAAAAFGAFTSLYAGDASELPKWNGWGYLTFSAKEGAMFGFVLSWPIALISSLVTLVVSLLRAPPPGG